MRRFLDANINFYPNKITYSTNKFQNPKDPIIMHDWETPIMKEHADLICVNGGHILEVGFGMGISANFIQKNNILSHTIIEIHPQIIKKAKQWAVDKPNVNILEGDWYDIIDNLDNSVKFDGVFYDTYGEWARDKKFPQMIKPHLKKDSLITHWNPTKSALSLTCNFHNHTDYLTQFELFELDLNKIPSDYIHNLGNIYYIPKITLIQ